jgi:hypothetical protein
MSQLIYSQSMALARAGMVADNGDKHVASKVNPVVAIPFGLAVCLGVDPDRDVKLPTSAAEAAAACGVALVDTIECSASGDPQYPIGSAVAVLRKGRVWVKVLEAVTAGDDVYVRYADGINDTNDDQKGAFGKSKDGTAQVTTVTPTAVNSTLYYMTINGMYFEYTSDGSATAGEIAAAFVALINAQDTLPVTASGTVTVILTADVAGTSFEVDVGANLAAVATTPNAGAAAKWERAKYLTSAAADGLAMLEVNMP